MHRRELKVIDSDAKVAEMYKELRKEGRRDAQTCMPVKQIPNLEWEKEKTEQNHKNSPEKIPGPTLLSSRHKQELHEVEEQKEKTPIKRQNRFAQISFQLQALYLQLKYTQLQRNLLTCVFSNYRQSITPSQRSSP